VLLNFFKVRVIINGKIICPLLHTKPVVIPVAEDKANIVVTDGHHFTEPLQINCHRQKACYCNIACLIDDNLLTTGAVFFVLLYFIGYASGMLFLKLLCLLPIFYFIFFYLFNKRDFLQIKQAWY
jgi:hypothetical protein